MSAKGRRLGLLVLLGCAASSALLSGCGIGIAGLVLWTSSSSDDDKHADQPPIVSRVSVTSSGCQDLIPVDFQIANEDGGQLSARIEFARFSKAPGGEQVPVAAPVPATPAPGSDPLDGCEPGKSIHFIWDAKSDLKDESAQVQIILTPSEDGVEGEPVRTDLFRAGNTPPRINDIALGASRDQILVLFQIVDEESDQIRLEAIEISTDGGENFSPLSGPVWDELPKTFTSAPGPQGHPGNVFFDLKKLAQPEFDRLRRPGFVGEVAVRLRVSDLPCREPSDGASGFLFDNNDPPVVDIIPVSQEDLSAGVIPIRYRLFDRDQNPASILVEVDLRDGKGYRPANEFPLESSEGTAGLSTLDPALFGDRTSPFHLFLWDARSQMAMPDIAVLSITGYDEELGPRSVLPQLSGFQLGGLLLVGDIEAGTAPSALTSGDFDGDSFRDIVVANSLSDDVTYLRGSPSGLIGDGSIPVGDYPVAVTSGDLDGDNFTDVVVANSVSDDVTYLRGSPSGLSRIGNTPTGDWPYALTSGDFDGDRHPEVAVVNRNSDGVTLLRGGAEGLVIAGEIPVADRPLAVTSGDLDGDSFTDVVVANSVSDDVTYLRGSPSGLSRIGNTPTGDWPYALTSGDFDGDRHPEVAVVNRSSDDVTLLRGGAEGLVIAGEIPVGDGPLAVTSGDLDGDSFTDVVVANSVSDDVTYLRGSPSGLSRIGNTPTGDLPYALTSGDFDRDGIGDVVVANQLSDDVSFLRGGAGRLTRVENIRTRDGPVALTVGDFDGDTVADVVVANRASNNVTYLRGRTSGLVQVGDMRLGNQPFCLTSGDFNGDRYQDVVVANMASDDVSYLWGNDDGLSLARTITVGDEPVALASADFNLDGFFDLLVANYTSNTLSYLQGGGDGLHGARTIAQQGGVGPRATITGHFSDDDYPDVLVANRDSDSVTYLRGGTGGLALVRNIPVGNRFPRSFTSGDFNGDGFLDAAVANSFIDPTGVSSVSYLRGSADGPDLGSNFAVFSANQQPHKIVSGDFNGDGYVDAVANNNMQDIQAGDTNSLKVFNGGESGLSPAGDCLVSVVTFLATGDFDGDGFPDVAAVGGDLVTCYRGGPNGLHSPTTVRAGYAPTGGPTPGRGLDRIPMVSGDFNGDGFPDVLIANETSGKLTFLGGTPRGLEEGKRIGVGDGCEALTTGDFNNDGFLDVAVAKFGSGTVTFFLQRYRTAHVNVLLDPKDQTWETSELLDPRNPAAFRLDLARDSLGSPTQICLIPGPVFDLPQAKAPQLSYDPPREKALRPEMYYLCVTDPVSILRATTELAAPARLVLRLRDHDPALLAMALAERSRLRVLRKDPGTGVGVDAGISPDDFEIVDFGRGKGLSFPISRFGIYVAVIVRDR